jgi:tetratricopeptide (TPR) repeat protein
MTPSVHLITLYKMRNKLYLAGILLLTFLLYLPEIHYSLVYDDLIQLVGNARLTSWSYVPGYFTTHLWAHLSWTSHIYYRPLFLLWFRIVDAIFGPPSDLWHLTSILAHLVAISCVFLLIRRVAGNFKAAALAALLFAIYPTQTETVAWVSSSGDLLLTCFVVLSVYFYVARKGPISWLSILFATLAIFTKEAGIVAPLLIFTYEWIYSRFKNAVVNTAPYALPVLLYFAFRFNALGAAVGPAYTNMTASEMILTWPRLLATYLFHLIWPVHLSAIYALPIEESIWPLLLLIIVLAASIWFLRKANYNIRFGAAWFALSLAPALAIRYITPNDSVHDRYLYLTSVGLALIVAEGVKRIHWNRISIAAAALVVLLLCWATRSNLSIWQNDITLFTRAVEVAPDNLSAKNNLAYAYLNANRPQEAFPLLQQLIDAQPLSVNVNYNLGRYYQQIGDQEKADSYFRLADPNYGK